MAEVRNTDTIFVGKTGREETIFVDKGKDGSLIVNLFIRRMFRISNYKSVSRKIRTGCPPPADIGRHDAPCSHRLQPARLEWLQQFHW